MIASRSWGWTHDVKQGIRDTTNVFNRFKGGEETLAYPLARGIAYELRKYKLDRADDIVPIPLSPDKAAISTALSPFRMSSRSCWE